MVEGYSLDEVGQDDGQSKVELLRYPKLPEARADLGYNWTEQSIDEILAFLGGFLKRNDAKAYVMDVYATNNQVYRNIVIHVPGKEVFSPEAISIQFNRDKGRQFSLVNELKEE